MPAKIPATVVTGFLGAGKTTLIRHMLQNAEGRKIALIINEFGDLGVDGDILKGCGEETCTEDDIKITVDYMLDLLPTAKGAMQQLGPAPAKPTLKRGAEVFDKVCSTCHVNGNMGAPKIGDQAAWSKRLQHGVLPLIRYALKTYKPSKSLGICQTCTDTDIIAAVKYMVNQSQAQGKDYALW